jgi:hypothetical protein
MVSEPTDAAPQRPVSERAVVYLYSQTGQLRDVAEALTAPMMDRGWQIRWVAVQPRVPFPFPWPVRRFFGVFPQSVDAETSVELVDPPEGFASAADELVILAYQVWYLAPSIPVRTLLKEHPEAVRDRPVVSLVACRNMWYSAAIEVSALLKAAGARSVQTVAATDTHGSFTTLVTTLRWLLTGHRERFLWFGRAGVGDDELARIAAVGRSLAEQTTPQPVPAPVVPALAAADLLAGRMFRRWGDAVRFSRRFGPAAAAIALTGFVGTLATGILVGLPLIAVAALAGGTRFASAVQRHLDRRMSFAESFDREAVAR